MTEKPGISPLAALKARLKTMNFPSRIRGFSLKPVNFRWRSVNFSWAKAQSLARDLLRTRLDKSGGRIRLLMLGLCAAYIGIGVKLVLLGVSHDPPLTLKVAADQAASGARPDLLDRNGEILATDIKTMSVFAEPRRIIDKDEAVELITAVLPDVDAKELRERLGSKKGFVWVKRQVTDKEQKEIFHLGLPGVGFFPENKRVYPNGPVGAHVIGFVDKDNIGIAGMERYLDNQSLTDPHVAGFSVDPASLKPVRLSLDLKVTHALRDELTNGMARFHAKAGAGAIIDVNTGEIIALESLPDFDPNDPPDMTKDPTRINRINVGVYEMGSTFKAISIAMALELGKVNLGTRVDARDSPALRAFHHPRLPCDASHSHRAGGLHPFLEYRHGAHGDDGRRRGASSVSEANGPARSAAHRIAGKRRAAGAEALELAEHDDDRLRPGPQCRADSGADGGGGFGQRRQSDDADFPHAQRGASARRQPSRGQRANVRIDALSHALQRHPWFGRHRQHSWLLRRRQNRHRRQDLPRPLFAGQGLHDLHGRCAGRQAEISLHGSL